MSSSLRFTSRRLQNGCCFQPKNAWRCSQSPSRTLPTSASSRSLVWRLRLRATTEQSSLFEVSGPDLTLSSSLKWRSCGVTSHRIST
ncbi:hypothetical protein GBAR_LOCUS25033 [Geodia barretti]|uniref:Uncharacterized protein n=1 Tax=Geodia barretti TaxID=519541 RepID=A0AA35XAD3_GEOBA|nr:hypothetical protein GBAR_LOCUS25033 [Geodia barretti]